MDGVRNAPIKILAYSPAQGISETIDALLRYYAEMGIDLSPDELHVTIGGSEAFVFALQATCDPGDEVLIPEPFYPNYLGHAIVNGIKVVPITTRIEDGFHLPPMAEIEKLVTPRTRAILFSNPGNPTGVGYTRPELEVVAQLAIKHELFVISDEPYRELAYESEAVGILSLPELRDHAILVDSISKRLSACGARLGCLASRNRDVMRSVNKLCMIRLSPPTFAQYGLIAFLSDPNHTREINAIVEKFRSRRDTLYNALQKLPGVVCRRPEGAFYIFVKLPQIEDSEDFAKFLLTRIETEGETVFVAPGSGFYATPGKGHDEVRIAYVLEEEKLLRAVDVLKVGLEAYTRQRQGVAAA